MIALAPNIARRQAFAFWRRWVAMLAGTLPVWIVPLLIAMAFPVMKPGSKILFKDGLMVFGGCTCCTGGGGGGCCTRTCSHCAGFVADQWTLSITGGACDGHCAVIGTHSIIVTGAAAGTYTVTTVGACSWGETLTSSLPVNSTDYTGTICAGSGTANTQVGVGLVQQSDNTLAVGMDMGSNGPVIDSATNASAASLECCTTSRTWSGTTTAECGGSSFTITASPC